jgi:hypothetical protein
LTALLKFSPPSHGLTLGQSLSLQRSENCPAAEQNMRPITSDGYITIT